MTLLQPCYFLLSKVKCRGKIVVFILCVHLFLFLVMFQLLDSSLSPRIENEQVQYPPLKKLSLQERNMRLKSEGDVFINCLQMVSSLVTNGSLLIPEQETLQSSDNGTIMCLYHRYVNTIQYLCPSKVRLGTLGQAGWTLCDDRQYSPNSSCTIYIITNHDRASQFLKTRALRQNCKTHIFYQRFSKTLTTKQDKNIFVHGGYRNSDEYIVQLNRNEVDILILDDMLEYLLLMASVLKSGLLRKVKQLVIRPHLSVDESNSKEYIRRLEIFDNLYKEGFRIHHVTRETSGVCMFSGKPDRTACYILSLVNSYSWGSIWTHQATLNTGNAVENSALSDYGKLYFRYVSSQQVLCKQMVRFGNIGDGGWEICNDDSVRPKYPCLVYSFGINNDFSFDDEIASNYGCEVHSFDPSMKKRDHVRSSGVHFHNIGISGSDLYNTDGLRMRRLSSIMHLLGHVEKNITILKMDVEGAEYNAIADIMKSNITLKIHQLVFEMHTRSVNDSSHIFIQPWILLQKLHDLGFRNYWTNFNPACFYIAPDSGKKRSHCIEISMLNTNFKASRD